MSIVNSFWLRQVKIRSAVCTRGIGTRRTREARIVIELTKHPQMAAKFMIKFLDTLLRIVSFQYLVLFFFQSKMHLWPFHFIFSACSLSSFPFCQENKEGSTELNNGELQLCIQHSGNYMVFFKEADGKGSSEKFSTDGFLITQCKQLWHH